jgi:multidrug efflux pump
MNPSRPFIVRPVATSLLMVAIFLSGVLGYRLLPQSALPEVDYPTIQVTTAHPGASPEIVATAITAPLERQFGAMAGLEQMSSTSSAGFSVINLRFGLDMNLDIAEQTVQAAIDAASSFLPANLPSPPIYSKINPADAPVLTLAVSSSTLPLAVVQDWADTRLVQKLSQIPGVGLVSLGGGARPAVRIAVNPSVLAARGLGIEQVQAAISAANSNQAKGAFDGNDLAYALETNGQLKTADEYRKLILSARQNSIVRLGDVAEISEGVEDTYLGAWANGVPAILLSVQRQPGSNVIAIVDRIRALLPQLEAALPASMKIEVMADRTNTIRSSIHDVEHELMIAVALVVLVIFLFLRTFSATLIPSLAVPLSLVGSFGVMHVLGFSINNLTLMALTIGTGFVVDDAIVMIENVARHIEHDKKPLEAALIGSKEIGFTIISLTCSLCAVLIPLLFMGDVVGRLFREFAVTLVVAIVISALVSLSFTPMLCARLLRAHNPEPGRVDRALAHFLTRYGRALRWILDRKTAALIATASTVLVTILLVLWIPKGFFPTQDTGVIQVVTEAPASVSFSKMAELQRQVADLVADDPVVRNVTSLVGIDGINPTLNSGRLLVNLKSGEERSESSTEIIRRWKTKARSLEGIRAYFQPVQDLTVEDRVTRAEYQYLLESQDESRLQQAVPALLTSLQRLPELEDLSTNWEPNGLAVALEVDRDRAARFGITMASIDNLLYTAFGQRFVSTIFTQTSQYRVVLEAARTGDGSAALEQLYATSADGKPVRLSSLVRLREVPASLVLHREKQSPAATLSFNLAPGTSLGEAVTKIEQERTALHLATGVETRFRGAALAFRAALSNELYLILASLITMYIVLGMLYESFVHPLTILSTLPSAGIGALLGLGLSGHELSVVAIIGIVLLIGIVQKNAIMIIDFALEAERTRGLDPKQAVYEACLLRFRPILMTTLAALLSAVPLVLGEGPGSELRKPLGIALVGGLAVSQVLTLFTTPVIYLGFASLFGSRAEPPTATGLEQLDASDGRLELVGDEAQP